MKQNERKEVTRREKKIANWQRLNVKTRKRETETENAVHDYFRVAFFVFVIVRSF